MRLPRGALRGVHWVRAALDSKDPRLLTRAFALVLTISFAGFTVEHLLRPVIPLMIVERGGDAIVVGFVASIHVVPSVLLRPVVGRLIDSGHHQTMLGLSAVVAAIASLGILIPGITALIAVRFIQGAGRAAYLPSTHALMAKLAPLRRRGEASGYFEAMPALATLFGPALGIGLFLAYGAVGPVALATLIGAAAVVITGRVRFGEPPLPPRTVDSVRESRIGLFIEPSALPVTVLITCFMMAQAIFVVFAPLYVLAVGAPVDSLVLFYPIYGTVGVLSRLVAGRISDRLGRGRTIRLGCVFGATGLAIAALGGGMLGLTLGGSVYGIGASLVAPTASALTMDRAPTGRLGSALATYGAGYQLGNGASSLLWGSVIANFGFAMAFSVAIGLQLVTVVFSLLIDRSVASDP